MNKTISQLIPAICCLVLMSQSSVAQAAVPGHEQWRPLPGQDSAPGSGNAYLGPPGAVLPPAHRPRVGNYLHGEMPYRFRPWEGGGNGYDQSRRAALPKQPFWRPAKAAAFAGYPRQGIDGRYRFRPMETRNNSDVPMRWTYRPSQIEIPNNYVYRPLKSRQVRHSIDQRRVPVPVPPAMVAYGYNPRDPMFSPYGYFGVPGPGMYAPGFDPFGHMGGYNPAWSAGPNLAHPGYRAGIAGYPVPRGAVAPRYTADMPASGYRFRPLIQPGTQRSRYRGQWARYAANPYVAAPIPPGYMPARPYPYGRYRHQMPPPISPAAVTAQAMWRPVMPNRYGVDWYDGRADGEGAWYKLAEQQEWPRVSQYEPLD